MNPPRLSFVLASCFLGVLGAAPGAMSQQPAEATLKISPVDSDNISSQLSARLPEMDPAYRALLENERQFFRNQGQNLPPLVSTYNQFGVLHVEFTSPQAREEFEREKLQGVFIFSRIDRFADYSNPGPARIGTVVKPDIVAPGQYWIVSEPDPRQLIGPRKYRAFNGTSAATPYVAGVIALMMQKKPTITVGEIKELLATHATKDPEKLLPAERRDGWGNGKLDADAVERIIRAIR